MWRTYVINLVMKHAKNVQYSLSQHAISQKNYYICQKYYIIFIKLREAYQKRFAIKKYYMKIYPLAIKHTINKGHVSAVWSI